MKLMMSQEMSWVPKGTSSRESGSHMGRANQSHGIVVVTFRLSPVGCDSEVVHDSVLPASAATLLKGNVMCC